MNKKILIFILLLLFNFNNLIYSKDVVGTDLIANIYEKVSDAIVNIDTEVYATIPRNDIIFRFFYGNSYDGKIPVKQGIGSGVIIDSEGHIVTNQHVIHKASKIIVTLKDGRKYEATVVGEDMQTDLAVLKIDSNEKFHFVNMGDSDKIRVGEWVIAIGSPYKLSQSLTKGIISAKRVQFQIDEYHKFDELLQTDASINPGNSGGPLINMEGEVVGINTAIIPYGQGLGFAIPISYAKSIIEKLKNHEEIKKAFLGVSIKDVDKNTNNFSNINYGAVIIDVYKNSPAYYSGIKEGDIIIEVDDEKIEDAKELAKIIRRKTIDDKIQMKVRRDRKILEFKVDFNIKNKRYYRGWFSW